MLENNIKSWHLLSIKRLGWEVPAMHLEKIVVLSVHVLNYPSDLREISQVYFIRMHMHLRIWLENFPFFLRQMPKVDPF